MPTVLLLALHKKKEYFEEIFVYKDRYDELQIKLEEKNKKINGLGAEIQLLQRHIRKIKK